MSVEATAFGQRPALVQVWRLDRDRYAPTWDSGEGAFLNGGRWNSPGTRVIYCAMEPATAILEVAVHTGFRFLDAVPHVLTSAAIDEPEAIHVLAPDAVPDPDWLRPGIPTTDQQAFGDGLLKAHPFVAVPSVVAPASWNVLISLPLAAGRYRLVTQARFVLDPRLNRS